jgi:hypothetical protein
LPRNRPTETVTKLIEVLPKGAKVHMHRASPICRPQLPHPLTHEHERHPPTFVLLDTVERATDRDEERGEEEIVGDEGWACCWKVFW